MQPTVLLADPALAFPRARRPAIPARRRSARIRWGWLLIGALLAVAGGGLAFLRMWPPLATVMSGSMAPTINTGDMVVLKRLDHPARLGDVVAVDVPDEARSRYGYPAVVIHRVIRIAADGTVTTKGDARKEPDPFTVPRAALGAEVVAKVPAGGRVLAFLSSGLGLLWLGAGAVLLFAMPLLDRQRDARRRSESEAGGLRAQLESITEELAELRYERLAERSALARRCDELSHDAAASQEQLQLVTAAFTEHLQQLPGQLAAAVAAVRPEPPPADPELAVEPPPEIPSSADATLAQLALALAHTVAAGVVPVDESSSQLAFALDVERRSRFARPCDRQLAFPLDAEPRACAQLAFSFTPPKPPAWDVPPPGVVRVRRRSGGLVGRAAERLRAVAAVQGLAAQPVAGS